MSLPPLDTLSELERLIASARKRRRQRPTLVSAGQSFVSSVHAAVLLLTRMQCAYTILLLYMLQSPAGIKEQQRSHLEGATSSPYRSLSPAARAPLQDAWRQRDEQADWHDHHHHQQQQPELNGHTYAPRLRFTEPLLDLLRQLEAQNADLEADRQAADERATEAEARIDTLQQELDVFREQASRARVEAVSAQSNLAARQDELARRLQEVARREAEAEAQQALVLEQVRQLRCVFSNSLVCSMRACTRCSATVKCCEHRWLTALALCMQSFDNCCNRV
jgi:hypothetical protein